MGYLARLWNALRGRGDSPAPVKPTPAPRPSGGRSARFDAAQTTDENRNHWANADGLSATSAASADVRYKLRTRARYEVANNGYAKALVVGRANDVIGPGPRLLLALPESYTDADFQVQQTTGTEGATPGDLARAVEYLWCEWGEAVGLADDLRLMVETEGTDGEAFAAEINNPRLPDTAPQLDLKVFEADQVTAVTFRPDDPTYVDGIRFDGAGNPVSYDVLRRHPGDTFNVGVFDFDTLPASRVYHLFERRRPGQARGVPPLTPSLPLYAILRRYTLATLGSAELAAMISGVITNENGPTTGEATEPPEIEAMDQVPFARNALLTLAAGQKAQGFDSPQPVSEYGPFKTEVLTEAGRSIGAAQNKSTGSSAPYNYSSGRLDHLDPRRGAEVYRERVERVVLDRLFRSWLREAALIPGYLPAGLPPVETWQWSWMWPGWPSIDPVKDATANQVALASGQTTLKRVCAEQGEHWEDVLRQRAREQKLAAELGLAATAAPAIAIQDADGSRTEITPAATGDGATDQAAAGAAATGDVQATALNGAQVTSLLLACDKLVAKEYTGPATDAILRGAFPGMDRAVITTIVEELEDHTPPAKPAAEPAKEEVTDDA